MEKKQNTRPPYNVWKTGIKSSNYRKNIIELMGSKCVQCGFSDIRALQIDHVNGGGRQEHLKGGHKWQAILLSNLLSGKKIENYQILCANCNWIKRVERKEYRHPRDVQAV